LPVTTGIQRGRNEDGPAGVDVIRDPAPAGLALKQYCNCRFPPGGTMNTETITRLCGHTVEFAPRGDGYDNARRAKLRGKRCGPCGVAKNLEDNAQARAKPRMRKGQELKLLPSGSQILLSFDGVWRGSLSSPGLDLLTAEGTSALGVIQKLGKKYLRGISQARVR
jgi:hypothetical protein